MGGALVGDKTVLDVLAPLNDEPQGVSTARSVERARQLLEDSDAWENRRGRAAWQGARTQGYRDPRNAAAVHFLEELTEAQEGSV